MGPNAIKHPFFTGEKMNVNRLIHIPGWGDFQLEKIEKMADPRSFSKKKSGIQDVNMSELVSIIPSVKLQDDMISENEPDMMDGEQTWPTAEELQEAELASSSIGDNAGLANKKKGRMMKVPKGTSEYQASWILEDGVENDEAIDENDEDDEDDDMNDEIEEEDESESSSEGTAYNCFYLIF